MININISTAKLGYCYETNIIFINKFLFLLSIINHCKLFCFNGDLSCNLRLIKYFYHLLATYVKSCRLDYEFEEST